MPIDPSTAFVSYSREDAEFAIKLAEDLKAGGASLWIDQMDIEPGERWARAVQAALVACPRMLVILSPASNNSDRVEDEVNFALEKRKTVIPVLYRDCEIPYQLLALQHVDFRTNYEGGLGRLLKTLGTQVERRAGSASVSQSELAKVSSKDDKLTELQRSANQGEVEQARREQEERERKAAEKKARKEELERQRIAAEHARLEEERNRDWKVNLPDGEFSSPSKDEVNSMIVFDSLAMKNGKMSASVTTVEGHWDANLNHPFREAGFLFRYHDREHFYVAGIGGFGKRCYIARVSGSEWKYLSGSEEPASTVQFNQKYDLRVEFESDRIVLFSDNVEVAKAIDDAYASGFCGLRTNRTLAQFRNVDIQAEAVAKRCFVIMPFDSKLSDVYSVIKQTVEEHGMECRRADETHAPKAIMEKVRNEIAVADLVVIDFTSRNPNGYYAGLAEAWKKTCIGLAQSGDDLALDVRHFDTIVYSKTFGGETELRENLQKAITEILEKSKAT